jgi:hypothetical protein
MSDVWPVFQGDNSENIEKQFTKKPLARVILYRQETVKIKLKVYF